MNKLETYINNHRLLTQEHKNELLLFLPYLNKEDREKLYTDLKLFNNNFEDIIWFNIIYATASLSMFNKILKKQLEKKDEREADLLIYNI